MSECPVAEKMEGAVPMAYGAALAENAELTPGSLRHPGTDEASPLTGPYE